MLAVLGRRFPLLEVEVLPVPVQGETAAAQIRGMLSRALASERYDLLVLARGGGSLEDLWAFNDEQLARAIAAASVPVVSAIGHETDFSLSDFAADLRAPTPSVAAELIAPDQAALVHRLQRLQHRLHGDQAHRLRAAMQRLDRATLRLNALRPQARLALLRLREQDARRRLEAVLARRLNDALARTRHAGIGLRGQAPQQRLVLLAQRLRALGARPRGALQARLQLEQQKLVGLARALAAVSPLATVARGYTILRHADGRLVRGIGDAAPGDRLDAELADGVLRLRVLD